MLAVFLLAGLRLGEQMALTRGQIDLEQGLIHVDRSVKLSAKSAQSIGLPKGGQIRTAVMCDALTELLRSVAEGMDSDTYVWSALTGNQPRMKKLVYATWRTIVRDGGLHAPMSPHDCRLTHINWIEKLCPNISPTSLNEYVGHSAQGVTEVNYTRPITPAQQSLRESLDSLFGH